MKRQDVHVGGLYMTKVSGKLVTVEIKEDKGIVSYPPVGYSRKFTQRHGGWSAINMSTGRMIHIRMATRLRVPVVRATPTSSEYL